MTIISGTVIENTINKKGEISSVIELKDPLYTSLTQRLNVPIRLELGSEALISIEVIPVSSEVKDA